jgi:site-specific DNA-methyltransferase (adenine-specific)
MDSHTDSFQGTGMGEQRQMMNQIFNEDCLETMRQMDNEFIDCIVTSPPYDNLRQYDGYSFDFESIAKEIYRIIKPNGVVVWVVGDQVIDGSESGSSFRQALYFKEIGFKLWDTMIYEKNSPRFAGHHNGNRYTQIFEYMFVFTKGKPISQLIIDKPNKWAGYRDWSKSMKKPVAEFGVRHNIWRYVTSFNSYGHPAPFPLDLAKDHIRSWTTEGQIVYDPFMGSGTTAEAARALNRYYIGSEVSENYCRMIENRLK